MMNKRKMNNINSFVYVKALFLLFIVMLFAIFAAYAEDNRVIQTTFETQVPGVRKILVGYNTDLKKSALSYDSGTLLQYVYSSDDPNIATVDSNGIVIGVSEGSTSISAYSEKTSRTLRFDIEVLNREPIYNAVLMANYEFMNPEENIAGAGFRMSIDAFRHFLEYTQYNTPIECIGFTRSGGLNFLSSLGSLDQLSTLSENDVTLFYLATHGARNAGFETTDGKLISYQEVYDGVKKIEGTVFILIDACYSGGLIDRIEDGSVERIKEIWNEYNGILKCRNEVIDMPEWLSPLVDIPTDYILKTIFGDAISNNNGNQTVDRDKYIALTAARNDVVGHTYKNIGSCLLGFMLCDMGFNTKISEFEPVVQITIDEKLGQESPQIVVPFNSKILSDGVVTFDECVESVWDFDETYIGSIRDLGGDFESFVTGNSYCSWAGEKGSLPVFILNSDALEMLGIVPTIVELEPSEGEESYDTGNEIIPTFQIDDIEPLQEFEPASFFTGILHAPFCEFIVNGKSGLVDFQGNVILEPLYDDVYYSEGAIHYYDVGLGKDTVYTYIDVPKETTTFGYDDYSVWYWDRGNQELRGMDVAGEEYFLDEWEGSNIGCHIIREVPNGDYEYDNLFGGGDLGGYGLANKDSILVDPKYINGLEYTFDGGGFFAFDDGAKWDIYGIRGNYGFSIVHKTITTSLGERTIYPYGITEQTLAINTDKGAAIWDLNSTEPLQYIYEEARPVYDGKAWVKHDGKWKIIEVQKSSEEGDDLIGRGWHFDDIQPVMGESADGYFINLPYNCVYLDGKVGLIDYDGNLIIEPQYSSIDYYGEGRFLPKDIYGNWLDETERYWYDDEDFETTEFDYWADIYMWDKDKHKLLSCWGDLDEWDIGTVLVREGFEGDSDYGLSGDMQGIGGYGLATQKELLVEPIYEYGVGYFSSRDNRWIFAFFDGQFWVYYNDEGDRILDIFCNGAYRENSFEEYGIRPRPYHSTEGIIAVNTDNGAGFYDLNGTGISGLIYEQVRPVYHGMAWVKQNGAWQVVELATGESITSSGSEKSDSEVNPSSLRTVKTYSGSVKVDFIRYDHSFDNGKNAVEAYYDLPVVTGKKQAAERINAVLQDEYELYVKNVDKAVESYIRDAEVVYATMENPYYYYVDVQDQISIYNLSEEVDAGVMYDDGKIISIVSYGYWQMGGVNDYPMYAHTFNIETGEEVSLIDLFPKWLDFSLETAIRDELWTELGLYQLNLYDASWYADYFYNYHLRNMKFFINTDGRLYICVERGQLGEGAMGALVIATNLYAGIDPADYHAAWSRVPLKSEIESTKGNIHLTEGAKSINLRSGPGLDYDSICTIHRGETADYLNATSTDERGVEWYKCSYNGIVGWVSSTYTILGN